MESKTLRAKRKFNVRLAIKTVFTCLCIIGCASQVISVLALYFQYKSNVVVSVVKNEHLTMPGITLCSTVG